MSDRTTETATEKPISDGSCLKTEGTHEKRNFSGFGSPALDQIQVRVLESVTTSDFVTATVAVAFTDLSTALGIVGLTTF